ncbi:DEAD/DEAH box helicase [Chitinispirillales bacterium ANBcel5]|uniref:DEAD/DEAH box helicase n=1 Tax=Cellulosispirillum alkaliphilum TaxID=3039283 RepID=UPI002A52D65E|nr:DEAD/DEAH box helicase [Chitinispirillales bacterium ANBcel5]
MSFAQFGLNKSVLQGVYGAGQGTPTEIQHKVIPLILRGRDVSGCAPTGTGKTAAFILPILTQLLASTNRPTFRPRVLVLAPTRELAQQLEACFRVYGSYTSLRFLSIVGGVGFNNQVRDLKNGADVLIATAGRLQDHIKRRSVDLSTIQTFVIDEADRMYDMGFIHDTTRIASVLPHRRQTLLFSATLPQEVRKIAATLQRNPVYIQVGKTKAPKESIRQYFYSVTQADKTTLLFNIINTEDIESMLVFLRKRTAAERLKSHLERKGIAAEVLHGERSQNQREQALSGFRRGVVTVLIATDVASRGLDISGVSHVINFDTPTGSDDYIHRIGRTGRAEKKGVAYTFVSAEEENLFKAIISDTGTESDLITCENRLQL